MPQRDRSIQISELFRGESEQAAYNRHPGAVESSDNVRFDMLNGATKRHHSELIADIAATLTAGGLDSSKLYYWLSIRQYAIAIGHGYIRAFDVTDGTSLPIDVDLTTEGGIAHDNGGDSGNTWDWTFDYLNSASPRTHITASVSYDTIIIANNQTTITAGYTDSFQTSLDDIIADIQDDEDPLAPAATVEFQGPVDSFDDLIQLIEPVKFRTRSEVDASPSPPYNDWSSGLVIELLKATGVSHSPQHWAVFDRWQMVDNDTKWYASLSDWYDDNADVVRIKNSEYLKNSADQVQLTMNHGQGKLVQRAKDGDVYRTKVDFGNDPAGYYVFYKGNADQGRWHRIPSSHVGDQQTSPGDGATGQDERGSRNGKYTASTMPIRALIDESGSEPRLSIGLIPWGQRPSGNVDINKPADFVGSTIQAVEFNQSRLFLITNEQVISSRENDFFNYWIDNVNNITDRDRIQKDINARNVGGVLHTDVLGTSLFIRCANGQLEFHSGEEALTSVNGRVQQVGDFKDSGVPVSGNGIALTLLDESLQMHQFQWTGARGGIQWMGRIDEHVPNFLGGLTVTGAHLVEQTTYIVTDRET